ncbi:hypothetical protein GOM49_12640 [Clostridium bovifaecis]|uniref:Pectate lyase superfamily protein domain-containing protein n=1 Tax=Clostridium bovifaecis TaxID=2184719 RepID=A0A6I6F655_9CLOT|nr:hypothetical protein GOM49_12640 [Clostridium bovifaecis]
MKKIKKFLVTGAALTLFFITTKYVYAGERIISNILSVPIIVEQASNEPDNGQQSDDEYINNAIKAAALNSTVKVKSGRYNLTYIEDKNITLDSEDGGNVDILVQHNLPQNVKLSDKVTINKEGLDPLTFEISIGDGSFNNVKVVKNNDCVTVEKEKGLKIKIIPKSPTEHILGFSKVDLMITLTGNIEASGKKSDEIIESVHLINGTYNLSKVDRDFMRLVYLDLQVDNTGEYGMEFWAEVNGKLESTKVTVKVQ